MGWRDWLAGAGEVDETRWVILDVETSGLDSRRDRLLAIAGVGLRVDWPRKQLAIVPGDSFEVVVRQQQTSGHDNILLHGIGVERQRHGVPMRAALEAFRAYTAHSPLLAFHAAFDEVMISRNVRAEFGAAWRVPWLDIEQLCAATHEHVRARSLDEWMAHFGIRCLARHQAAADALAESELLLRIWPRVASECASWADVERLARRQRWLPRA